MKLPHAKFEFKCFHCGQMITLFHLNWTAITCTHCSAEIGLQMLNNDNVTLKIYNENI